MVAYRNVHVLSYYTSHFVGVPLMVSTMSINGKGEPLSATTHEPAPHTLPVLMMSKDSNPL